MSWMTSRFEVDAPRVGDLLVRPMKAEEVGDARHPHGDLEAGEEVAKLGANLVAQAVQRGVDLRRHGLEIGQAGHHGEGVPAVVATGLDGGVSRRSWWDQEVHDAGSAQKSPMGMPPPAHLPVVVMSGRTP